MRGAIKGYSGAPGTNQDWPQETRHGHPECWGSEEGRRKFGQEGEKGLLFLGDRGCKHIRKELGEKGNGKGKAVCAVSGQE